MKVLFIVGTCLSKNTSANMSHNSYIQGFLDNGCQVDVIMKNNSWGQTDTALRKLNGVNYIEYEANSFIDNLRSKFTRRQVSCDSTGPQAVNGDTGSAPSIRASVSAIIRSLIKPIAFTLFPQDKIYPLDKKWLDNAASFFSKTEYDIVVSNSSPSASHKLAHVLLNKGHVKTKRWVQIWEDPWYHDLYGGHSEVIKDEEKNLLDAATEIFYVSPLTTEYQKKYYPTAAHKMKTIALPYFALDEHIATTDYDEFTYGYFGDYYSHTRNLLPFFYALDQSGRHGYIYGDSDIVLTSECIEISPRITLDRLKSVQQKASVLVHLCNLRGGQIPGKIYHYSATNKPILFILDGTDEERVILRNYFGQYDRYYFCDNNENSILNTFGIIEKEAISKTERPIEQFKPKEVVRTILLQ